MRKQSYYWINAITLYRLVAAPLLVLLIFAGEVVLFSWLLAVSFFTDAIDGFLARKFKVTSVFGSKLDSVSDDLTMLAGMIGLVVLKMEFLRSNLTIVMVILSLLIIQNLAALIRYHKISSFHTYSAKFAAVLQGSFLILMFFLKEPVYPLFYVASIVTALDFIEEIILVCMLPKWKQDVKGIYWVMQKKAALPGI
jgi:CDP-diacylglycerol--glycerol-3-phosphate 3-phosphatidyltransferase